MPGRPWLRPGDVGAIIGRLDGVFTPGAHPAGVSRHDSAERQPGVAGARLYDALFLACGIRSRATAMFQLAIANAWYVARNEPSVPPVILVGIVNGADRLHDMTPPATGSSVAEFPTAGGADALADFITDEVLPMVRTRTARCRPRS